MTPDPVEPIEGSEVPAVVPTSGPWARDLEATFADPEVRQAVDGFLRSTVQPHVTKLEQQTADLADAQQLYTDLLEKPGETFLALTQELFGDDSADAVYKALQAGDVVEVPDGEGGTELEVKNATALDPETASLLAQIKEERDTAAYNKAVSDVVEAHKDEIEVVPALFHPFVHSADGDMDAAYEGYKQHYTAWAAKYGGPAAVDPAAPAVAPATLGGSAPTGSTPVQKTYESLDSALDDFFNEQKAAPATI